MFDFLHKSDPCGRFFLAADMNFDGAYTISDLWLQISYFWLLPAKLIVLFVEKVFPPVARFLEWDCGTGTGWIAGFVVLPFWTPILVIALVFFAILFATLFEGRGASQR